MNSVFRFALVFVAVAVGAALLPNCARATCGTYLTSRWDRDGVRHGMSGAELQWKRIGPPLESDSDRRPCQGPLCKSTPGTPTPGQLTIRISTNDWLYPVTSYTIPATGNSSPAAAMILSTMTILRSDPPLRPPASCLHCRA
jgi:hypothetical protein